MIKHKRILVPVELGATPDYAFDRALVLARKSGAELYLLHAVPLHHPYGFRAELRAKRFRDLRERALVTGVPVQVVEQQGDAADVIVLHADTRPVDLIIMSSERRRGWKRLRKPSVTESVLRRTIRPTLVVRPDDNDDAFTNALVGVDLSNESAHLLNSVMALPGIDVRHLTVVHAVEQIEAADAFQSPARWKVGEYRSYMLDGARREVAQMMQGVETAAKVDVRVSGGSADDVIERHATDLDPDVIVIGRSNRLLPFASTATRLLRNTGYSVLVVPPPVRETRSIYKRAA
jgi:nucleotide-binding universal stress UspA family protein